jgi:hypothetical protein
MAAQLKLRTSGTLRTFKTTVKLLALGKDMLCNPPNVQCIPESNESLTISKMITR